MSRKSQQKKRSKNQNQSHKKRNQQHKKKTHRRSYRIHQSHKKRSQQYKKRTHRRSKQKRIQKKLRMYKKMKGGTLITWNDIFNSYGAKDMPLMVAAKNNNVEEFMKLKHQGGTDFNATDEKGNTALMFAVVYDSEDIVVKLLGNSDAHKSIEHANDSGMTALLYAAQYEKTNMMGHLLWYDASINKALLITAKKGWGALTDILLNLGADVNSADEFERSALIYAAQNNYPNLVKFLIERGAYIEKKDNNGWNALMHAAYNGHSQTRKILVDYTLIKDNKIIYEEASQDLTDKKGYTAKNYRDLFERKRQRAHSI